MDRTGVIIEIFHRHARSRTAKAQVEIVRLLYMAPRLRELKHRGRKERQRGGKGGKGSGDTQHELDRRRIRDRIVELNAELDGLEKARLNRRARRQDLRRAALVGYTNAGKSTLMRALTGSDVLIADKLFATLETTVRVLHPEAHPRILMSDTVGFIEKLPHGLVASFKTTLDEALEASLLVHVIDASDPAWPRQRDVTLEVLGEIGAGEIRRLVVFNKIDRLGDDDDPRRAALEAALAADPDAIAISARRPEDVAALRQRIVDVFAEDLVEAELLVPWDRQALRATLFEDAEVLGESHDEAGARFRIRAPEGVLAGLREALARRA
jgi:GTP-binding protein HflX